MSSPIKIRKDINLDRRTMKESDKIKLNFDVKKLSGQKRMVPNIDRKDTKRG